MFLTVCLNPTIQKTLQFSSIVPGTVNRAKSHRLDVSGKGINVTRVLTQLGKKAMHLTQLGGDMRPLFLSMCEQDKLSVEWVESNCLTSGQTGQIRFCYTVLTDTAVTELVEESEAVAPGTEERLLEKFDALLEKKTNAVKCLIISGTKATGFSDMVIPDMVRKAKEKGISVIIDIKGKDLINSLQYEPDVVKPNLFEFAGTFMPDLIKDNDLAGNDNITEERIKSTVMEIAQKYKCRIILTNGSRKILAADKSNFYYVEFEPVKAVNSTGCGDAFTAGLTSAMEDNWSANHPLDFNAAINEGIRCGALNANLVKPGVIR
ncbi:MAG: PfkB family carbohydrate kinase [Treponema sp.]|nr:PfkB family carbohydrate kinase [Treponema sp.]